MMLLLLSLAALATGLPPGDWLMTRGGPLRGNRASIRGRIQGVPHIAWHMAINGEPATVLTADLDEDGQPETYAAENGRVVRRDLQGQPVWRSEPISRRFTLIAFEDLDGDGQREPLLRGEGLNDRRPLLFVLDPATGRIRWQVLLNATNGGDLRLGRILPERKGLQLLQVLFPNPGGGELHLFCWDQGIEQGYALWSWTRHDDFIYFPQLAVGDANDDGRNEVLMLSQMCIWMFDIDTGSELGRVAWGPRTRSYGGHFGLWPMRPGGKPAILVVSAYNRMSVVDVEGDRLALRWDHPFEPGVDDSSLQGKVEFLPDGVGDLDGDGWAEVIVNQFAGEDEESWRVLVLSARDGAILSQTPGRVMVGAADVDGDGRAEVFLRARAGRHDPTGGPVSVARWRRRGGLEIVWSSPEESTLVREPNDPVLRLGRHPHEGDRVKLACAAEGEGAVFFLRAADGTQQGFAPAGAGFAPVDVPAPPDPPPMPAGGAAPRAAPDPPLAVDFNGDGVNEVVQCTASGAYAVVRPPRDGQPDPVVIARLDDILAPPTFADLDGDGRVEMIAIRAGELDPHTAGRRQPFLEASGTDGRLLWRRTWPADHAYRFTPGEGGFAILFVAVGRFTGRNPLDVVISYTGERIGGHTAVLDGRTGDTVWDLETLYPGMYGSCWDRHPPVVFDFDGDGLDDLATVCQTVHYTILRGRDGRQLVDPARDASSQGFGGQPPLFPDAWAVGAQLGGADVDGDGAPELAVLHSQGAVGVLRADGEPLWFLDLPVVEAVPHPGCWADVDGDGLPETVFIGRDGVLSVYRGATGERLWEEDLAAWGSLTAADIDGDGTDEILFSSERGRLVCLSRHADPRTGTHVRWARDFDAAPGPAIFADLDGDGLGEILLPVADGFLYCLR